MLRIIMICTSVVFFSSMSFAAGSGSDYNYNDNDSDSTSPGVCTASFPYNDSDVEECRTKKSKDHCTFGFPRCDWSTDSTTVNQGGSCKAQIGFTPQFGSLGDYCSDERNQFFCENKEGCFWL